MDETIEGEAIPPAELPPPAEPEPTPADDAGRDAAIAARLAAIEALLAEHLEATHGLARDAFGRAHAEIDRLRDAAGLASLRPLLNEILSIRDDLSRLIDHYGQAPRAEPAAVRAGLDGVRTEIDELLGRRGVVAMEPPAGRFDRETQRAVRFEPADDPADDLAVVAELRTGFYGPAGVVRRADVVIRRHVASTSSMSSQPQGAR